MSAFTARSSSKHLGVRFSGIGSVVEMIVSISVIMFVMASIDARSAMHLKVRDA